MTEQDVENIIKQTVEEVADRLDNDMYEHFDRVYNWDNGYCDNVWDNLWFVCRDQLSPEQIKAIEEDDDARDSLLSALRERLSFTAPKVEVYDEKSNKA